MNSNFSRIDQNGRVRPPIGFRIVSRVFRASINHFRVDFRPFPDDFGRKNMIFRQKSPKSLISLDFPIRKLPYGARGDFAKKSDQNQIELWGCGARIPDVLGVLASQKVYKNFVGIRFCAS